MRDPNRIPKILKEVEIIWKKYPDLRLGQLIVIAATNYKKEIDIFHIEDDNFLEGLEKTKEDLKNQKI